MVPSTVASDLVLACTCAGAGVWLWRAGEEPRRHAVVGMALMAAAAGLGCVRYAGVEAVIAAHRLVSQLAGAVAPACFALVALAVAALGSSRRRVVELGLLGLIFAWFVFARVMELGAYSLVIGTLAVVVATVLGVRDRSKAGASLALGALTLALAGLVIGNEGTIGPLLAIDVFHVVLAAAHLAIAYGLLGLARR